MPRGDARERMHGDAHVGRVLEILEHYAVSDT